MYFHFSSSLNLCVGGTTVETSSSPVWEEERATRLKVQVLRTKLLSVRWEENLKCFVVEIQVLSLPLPSSPPSLPFSLV